MRSLSGWLIALMSITFLGAGLLLANSGGPNMDENETLQDHSPIKSANP